MNDQAPAWDAAKGTAGGTGFGGALGRLLAERDLDGAALEEAAGLEPGEAAGVLAGTRRLTLAQLAALAGILKLRAIEFLQKTEILSLESYAAGLDPLYFLPAGQVRHDARIYMREINPRHAVPERDMLVRNPALKALAADEMLDRLGKLELELAYLLRVAAQVTGGSL
jgi:transcriptional regulator with XRE-family HTH domain